MELVIGIIAIFAILVLVATVIFGYNALVRARNAFKNAFAQIDVQLRRRFDLIPNLLETAKAYMAHERQTLEAVVNARNVAMTGLAAAQANPGDPAAMQQLSAGQQALNGALGRFNALAESYPDLKASQNFIQLQGSLNEVEDRLSASRRTCNAAITDLNNAVEMFPSSLIASWMGLTRRPVLEIPEAERKNVDVGQLFQS